MNENKVIECPYCTGGNTAVVDHLEMFIKFKCFDCNQVFLLTEAEAKDDGNS